MIYEYCLVVGKVYPLCSKLSWESYGYEQYPTAYRLPDTALLAVSRQINLEAEKILYSRNTFVMPVLEDMEELYQGYLDTPRRNALPWIRSVEVAFHTHDLSSTQRRYEFDWLYSQRAPEAASMRPVEQNQLMDLGPELHDTLIYALTDTAWSRKGALLTTKLRLDTLKVFLEGAWCLCQCCPLENEAVKCLKESFVLGLPSHIEIVGAGNVGVQEAMISQIRMAQNRPKWLESDAGQ